jgi:predicted amidophosphoribosyltransferase
VDLVVPIPLHYKKFKKRGYNQCDSFAKGIAETLNVKILDVTGKLVDAFDYKNVGKSNSVNINWNAESRGVEVRSGLYFVEVRSNGNVVRTKLVKY